MTSVVKPTTDSSAATPPPGAAVGPDAGRAVGVDAGGAVGVDAGGAEARYARLRAGVSGLGPRRGLDTERMLLIAGSIVLPLGVLFILLGWAGAAHTTRLFEQIPYLISGGILGGALVVAGGFLYFGYWLTRLVYEGRSQSRQMTELLARVADRLEALDRPGAGAVQAAGAGAGAGAGSTVRTPRGGDGAERGADGVERVNGNGHGQSDRSSVAPALVATATGTMLHSPGCSVVANKQGLRQVPAGAEGFRPCRICDPLSPPTATA